MGIEKEIVIEIERVRVVCQKSKRRDAWCDGCGDNSEFISPFEAATLTGQSLEQIAELASLEKIHNLMTPAQTFLVCLNSLLRTFESSSDTKIIQLIKNK